MKKTNFISVATLFSIVKEYMNNEVITSLFSIVKEYMNNEVITSLFEFNIFH